MEANTQISSRRIGLVVIALLLAFVLLIAQLVRWQVVERKRVLPPQAAPAAAEGGQNRGPERGIILDKSGQVLAIDTYRWEIWVQPSLVKPTEVADLTSKLVAALGPELKMTPTELQQVLASGDSKTYTLARRAPQAVGEAIRSWESADLRAIGLKALPTRLYPQHALAAHVLGFVNDEPRAYYGVEQRYDDYLRSLETPFLKSDPWVQSAYGQLPEAWQQYLPSETGQDLVLTIDRRIQYRVERILANAIGKYRALSGTIIVMDPTTGAILAMASLPAYDPNRYGTTVDTSVLVDPAISQQYEPGSVFKVVTMASAIDAGIITPDTVITDTEKFEYSGEPVQNWDRKGLGPITIREALIKSRNVPTAQVAVKMGESLFYQYVRRFGFDQLTEVDLANESPGTVKVPGDPLWSPFDLATNSFGQGLAVTPLQVTAAVSVIANGGLLVRPHVAEAMIYRGQVIKPGTTVIRRVIKPETAATMRSMMVDVVENGTKTAQVPGYRVAGKTGTAQIATESGYHLTETIHSFVGFAPAENPIFVALVKLDKPTASPWAEYTAAPTFAELTRELMFLLGVSPNQVALRP